MLKIVQGHWPRFCSNVEVANSNIRLCTHANIIYTPIDTNHIFCNTDSARCKHVWGHNKDLLIFHLHIGKFVDQALQKIIFCALQVNRQCSCFGFVIHRQGIL